MGFPIDIRLCMYIICIVIVLLITMTDSEYRKLQRKVDVLRKLGLPIDKTILQIVSKSKKKLDNRYTTSIM